MKVTVLMEDTAGRPDLLHEHGLCFYIETKKHKILLDTGASSATWENAIRLGIDLTSVDTVVLSHGHYDHSGGILSFAQKNPHAAIYLQKGAELPHFNGRETPAREIGIAKEIAELPSAVFTDGDVKIDGELFLFSGITGRKLWPQSNIGMMKKGDAGLVQDDFSHEQCLVISEEGKQILFSGCAHNGILNILSRYHDFYTKDPSAVFSGFHMVKKSAYTEEEEQTISDTADLLSKQDTVYYTGHCTSVPAYEIMKKTSGLKMVYFHPGDTFEL